MTNLYLHSIAGAEKAFQELSAAFKLAGIAQDRAEEKALGICDLEAGYSSSSVCARGCIGFPLKEAAT